MPTELLSSLDVTKAGLSRLEAVEFVIGAFGSDHSFHSRLDGCHLAGTVAP